MKYGLKKLRDFIHSDDSVYKNSKIMIVDDSEDILMLIENILKMEGFIPEIYKDPGLALSAIDKTYDLIILDLMMPLMSGEEFLKKIRERKDLNLIPIIILTAKNNSDEDIAGIYKIGANDYVQKPFLRAEFISKIKVHIKLKKFTEVLLKLNYKIYKQNIELKKTVKEEELLNEKILERTLEIKKAKEEIEDLNKGLKYTSTHDSLTTIYNRFAILSFLENDINRTKRINKNLSLIMYDIDFFKKINDNYGHIVGDSILQELSLVIKENIRDIDLVGRYGGEEFLIILPDTCCDEGLALAKRLLELVRNHKFHTSKGILQITISIGISQYIMGESIDLFIDRVDKSLYEAKNSGRDCIKNM